MALTTGPGGMHSPLEDFFSPFFTGWPYSTTGAGVPGLGGGGAGMGTADTGVGAGAPAPTYTRSIPVDFIERQDEYVLRADIPGVHKSEIRVSVDGNVVRFGHSPHPDREQSDEQEQGIFHRAERVSSFRGRALRMPDNADMEKIQAKYEDGVLELRIAKKAMQQPKAEGRTIQIA